MSFLDDIDKKITTWGQDTAKKTKDVSETAKISSQVSRLENQKKDCFAELGSIFLEECLKKDNYEKDKLLAITENTTKEIERLEQEIEQMKIQLAYIKGVMICPECKAEIPVDSMFCSSCGNKIEHAKPQSVMKNVCPQCGEKVEDGYAFCISCGYKLA